MYLFLSFKQEKNVFFYTEPEKTINEERLTINEALPFWMNAEKRLAIYFAWRLKKPLSRYATAPLRSGEQ